MPDGARTIECPVCKRKAIQTGQLKEVDGNYHLQFDHLIKRIAVRKIGGNMLNKVLPPRWRRESVKYSN